VIDFRYHVVSIVAVFLALAVGIVLGSGPLKDDISGFLEDRTEQLAQEKVDLQSQVSSLRNEVEYNQKIAEVSQPVLLDQLLAGHVTTVLVLPDADGDQVKAVEDAIDAAGGQVGERVTIEPSWGDPDQSDVLGRVAEGIAKGGHDEDPYTLAGQVLADALLTPGGRPVGEESLASVGTLAAFEGEGFISADEGQVTRADTAIVVGPEGAVPNADQYVVPLVGALDGDGLGTVLTAPAGSDASDGVVGVLRDSDSDGVVSTEDRLETVNGVTVTVAALAEQIAGGVGHYGTGDGSDAPAPDPWPRG
jgi:hypothetical protein